MEEGVPFMLFAKAYGYGYYRYYDSGNLSRP